ncbi:MAG: hypothetical protein MK135_06435 [Polyangiaceae bacterium]|nr:hypothetical protein [Polyangiaceae bacterium]
MEATKIGDYHQPMTNYWQLLTPRLSLLTTLSLSFLACSPSKLGGAGDGNGSGVNGPNSGAPGGGGLDIGGDGLSVPGRPGGGTTGSSQGCDANTPCPSGEACVAKVQTGCNDTMASSARGVCRAALKECTTDADCGGDTICCVGDCAIDGAGAGSCVRPCGVDESCKDDDPAVGVFNPSPQCEWSGPAEDDPYTVHARIMATPLVANTPHDSGAAAEIIIVTGDEATGATNGDFRQIPGGAFQSFDANSQGGVIRILNGQTCEQVELIDTGDFVRSPATPSIADLDGDGLVEIVTRAHYGAGETKLIAFKWNGSKYERYWKTTVGSPTLLPAANKDWDGPSIHDLTDDQFPEVIGRNGAVFDGRTGDVIAAPNSDILVFSDPVVGDVDVDGVPDLVANKIYNWNGSGWTEKYPGPNKTSANAPLFYAYADFGTPSASGFDFNTLDGVAEIVTSGSEGLAGAGSENPAGHVAIYALDGTEIARVSLPTVAAGSAEIGGAPTIGDFDNDGFPEIGLASGSAYTLIDPECTAAGGDCLAKNVRWSRPAVDERSSQTGSSLFDFETDGKVEAVYGDECFLRIYDGESGEVLFSQFRRSCTWWENAVIADPDQDTRTEIILNSNLNCQVDCGGSVGVPVIDPIHPGIRCEENSDCISGACEEGLCRCQTQEECGETVMVGGNIGGHVCTDPLPGTAGTGKVCRMQHPNKLDPYFNRLTVLRDVLDRWSESRSIWNQHAYNITNVNDDGTVPPLSSWEPNMSSYNNFRQNVQGEGGANLLPDITSILSRENACQGNGTSITLTGSVCNRGLRVVGADMPATFYLGATEEGNILCVSYTQGPVQLGDECLPVSCTVDEELPAKAQIYMKVNDDGAGNRTTEECDESNNVDQITIPQCTVVR